LNRRSALNDRAQAALIRTPPMTSAQMISVPNTQAIDRPLT
jgi:hypothetical protein